VKVFIVSDIEGVAGIVRTPAGVLPPYDPGRPCETRVVFNHSDGVDPARRKPGVEVVGPREIVSRADDWWSAWRQFCL
jgi:D-aminopeptidase